MVKVSQERLEEFLRETEVLYKVISERNMWQQKCTEMGEESEITYKDVSKFTKAVRMTIIQKRRLLYNPRKPSKPKARKNNNSSRFINFCPPNPIENFQKIHCPKRKAILRMKTRSEEENFSENIFRKEEMSERLNGNHQRKTGSLVHFPIPSDITRQRTYKARLLRSFSKDSKASTEISNLGKSNQKTIKSLMMDEARRDYFRDKGSHSHRDIRFFRNKSLNHSKMNPSVINQNRLPFFNSLKAKSSLPRHLKMTKHPGKPCYSKQTPKHSEGSKNGLNPLKPSDSSNFSTFLSLTKDSKRRTFTQFTPKQSLVTTRIQIPKI